MKIICLDVETTGLSPGYDEVIQLSMIDEKENVLFNKYIKPKKHTSWDEAEYVHGITPAHVENEPHIDFYLEEINRILDGADLLVGYNSDSFDIPFLEALGVNFPKAAKYYDVMHMFSPIYGEWNDYYGDYKWQKLSTCAEYYGYGDFAAHDSLEDVKATLYCFYRIQDKEQTIEVRCSTCGKRFDIDTDLPYCERPTVCDSCEYYNNFVDERG